MYRVLEAILLMPRSYLRCNNNSNNNNNTVSTAVVELSSPAAATAAAACVRDVCRCCICLRHSHHVQCCGQELCHTVSSTCSVFGHPYRPFIIVHIISAELTGELTSADWSAGWLATAVTGRLLRSANSTSSQ